MDRHKYTIAARQGSDYVTSLQDGRSVWLLGEGRITDVTTHPATAPMVREYAAWYDRHFDTAWRNSLLTSPDVNGRCLPLQFEIPKSSDNLRSLSTAISRVLRLSAGNITHTPGYGALIALGLSSVVQRLNVTPEQVEAAVSYRQHIAQTGRFLTFAAAGTVVGHRLRSPITRSALQLIRQTPSGITVSGKLAMNTSSPFAEDVLIACREPIEAGAAAFWFLIPANADGVRIVVRPPASRHANPFLSPLSSRFDELDAQIWLDKVFVPRDRVFTGESQFQLKPHSLSAWLYWHQCLGWLARAEFSLGLAFALEDVMGLTNTKAASATGVDLMIDVQTIRSCLVAACCEPETTEIGYAVPGQLHVAAASVYALKARQRMSELLRGLPGSSLFCAPADTDLASDEMAGDLEDAFGGRGVSALQRAALLHLTRDHVGSLLDAREAAFELHANGGLEAWRKRISSWFRDSQELRGLVDGWIPK